MAWPWGMWQMPPSEWPIACTMPTMAFEKLAPASKLPSASEVRTSRSPGSSQERTRFSEMSAIAWRGQRIGNGVFLDGGISLDRVGERVDAVVAVSFGGSEAVSSGSRKATCGTSL